jgi:hypothetical protein
VKKGTKLMLLEDDQEPFDLIGICSGLSDYRLAWNLNKAFGWAFEHSDTTLKIPNKKSGTVLEFSFYQQLGLEDYTNLYLVKNKQLGKPLLEDLPQLDYVLIIKNNLALDLDELVDLLRQHEQLIAAYRYDSSAFSISEYLQFEESYE